MNNHTTKKEWDDLILGAKIRRWLYMGISVASAWVLGHMLYNAGRFQAQEEIAINMREFFHENED